MGDLTENRRISRRQFLRVVSFSSGGIAFAPFLSAYRPLGELNRAHHRRFYRATQDGRLQGSADGSKWEQLANFGPHISVCGIKQTRDGWVLLTLSCGDGSFVLKSRDEKTWYTLDYSVPGLA